MRDADLLDAGRLDLGMVGRDDVAIPGGLLGRKLSVRVADGVVHVHDLTRSGVV